MTCPQARDYLFAFLDNELDAPLSIEFQRHLERCPDCAREAEIERTVGKHLVETMGTQPVPALDESLGGVLRDRQSGRSSQSPPLGRRRVRWRPALAVAAAVVVTVGTAWWIGLTQRASTDSRGRFAELAVADFVHFLEAGRPLQITSADPREVARWLRGQTGLELTLPVPTGPRSRLLGGRKCKIAGRPAAFAVYELNGVPASVVVVGTDPEALAGMERIGTGDRAHWVDRCDGHTVVACLRDGLVYGAVSSLGREELFGLITGVVYESD